MTRAMYSLVVLDNIHPLMNIIFAEYFSRICEISFPGVPASAHLFSRFVLPLSPVSSLASPPSGIVTRVNWNRWREKCPLFRQNMSGFVAYGGIRGSSFLFLSFFLSRVAPRGMQSIICPEANPSITTDCFRSFHLN